MLLQEFPSLEELLVLGLIERPGASAKELNQWLSEHGNKYSLRGIYKELTKLSGQGIVFKTGESYSIHLAWIMQLLALGDRAFESYTQSPYLLETLRSGATKQVERFSDLRKLDRLWTQLILALHTLHRGKTMCFWCPYQWFYLTQLFAVKQFYQAIDLAGHKRLHIIGTDTFLGRRALKDLPKHGKYSFAESPFHRERSTYYTVIGDMVLTVKLDTQTTDRLDELFSAIQSERDINPSDLETFFRRRVRATLTCERDEVKAERLKKKFRAFFDEDFE